MPDLIGMYFRVQRNNEWTEVDIAELTDDELDEILKDRSEQWLANCVKILAKWLRDNVRTV